MTGRLAPHERAAVDQNRAAVDHVIRHIRAHQAAGHCDEAEICPGVSVVDYVQNLPCNELERFTFFALIQLAARTAELETLRGDGMPPLDPPERP